MKELYKIERVSVYGNYISSELKYEIFVLETILALHSKIDCFNMNINKKNHLLEIESREYNIYFQLQDESKLVNELFKYYILENSIFKKRNEVKIEHNEDVKIDIFVKKYNDSFCQGITADGKEYLFYNIGEYYCEILRYNGISERTFLYSNNSSEIDDYIVNGESCRLYKNSKKTEAILVNKKGKIVLLEKNIEKIKESFFVDEKDKIRLFPQNIGNIQKEEWEEVEENTNEMIKVQKNNYKLRKTTVFVTNQAGLVGLYHLNTMLYIIPCNYKKLELFHFDTENKLYFKAMGTNGLYGILDQNGLEVIPCEYTDIIPENLKHVHVRKGNLYGIFDPDLQCILPCEYMKISNFMWKNKNTDQIVQIGRDIKEVEGVYCERLKEEKDRYLIIDCEKNLYEICNSYGEKITSQKYSYIEKFDLGDNEQEKIFIVQKEKNGLYYIYKNNMKELSERGYKKIIHICEGFLLVQDPISDQWAIITIIVLERINFHHFMRGIGNETGENIDYFVKQLTEYCFTENIKCFGKYKYLFYDYKTKEEVVLQLDRLLYQLDYIGQGIRLRKGSVLSCFFKLCQQNKQLGEYLKYCIEHKGFEYLYYSEELMPYEVDNYCFDFRFDSTSLDELEEIQTVISRIQNSLPALKDGRGVICCTLNGFDDFFDGDHSNQKLLDKKEIENRLKNKIL